MENKKPEESSDNGSSSKDSAQETLKELADQFKQMKVVKTGGKASMDEYKFWKTQPVRKFDDEVVDNGQIEKELKTRATPLALPAGFEWCAVDLNSDSELNELLVMLQENYVEDLENTFRFNYSAEILKWALMPPGFVKDWHLGIRTSSNKKLVAFIGGVPMTLRVYDRKDKFALINFLCIHKKLRSKRLAPVMIMEVTRRIASTGIIQALYTSGTKLPVPFCEATYYHRTLNAKKLVEIGFTYLRKHMTLARMIKLFKLPDRPQTPGFREMKRHDVEQAYELWKSYSADHFDLCQSHTLEEFAHFILPVADQFLSFVVEGQNGEITSFISFYFISNTVIGNSKYSAFLSAYLWLYVAENDEKLRELVNDAMIVASKKGCDVFNCTHIMKNDTFVQELKFQKGDGRLNYYLYNWRCPDVDPSKMGFLII